MKPIEIEFDALRQHASCFTANEREHLERVLATAKDDQQLSDMMVNLADRQLLPEDIRSRKLTGEENLLKRTYFKYADYTLVNVNLLLEFARESFDPDEVVCSVPLDRLGVQWVHDVCAMTTRQYKMAIIEADTNRGRKDYPPVFWDAGIPTMSNLDPNGKVEPPGSIFDPPTSEARLEFKPGRG